MVLRRDAAGEADPVNLPGISLDAYPSWRRRLSLPVEALPTDTNVRHALAGTRERRVTPVRQRPPVRTAGPRAGLESRPRNR